MTVPRTRSTRFVIVVGMLATASLLAGCGNADETASEPKPKRAEIADKPRTAAIDGSGCLIGTDVVADAIGSEVVDQGITGGSTSNPETTISWSGCTFETDDGTTYRVAELVGDDGRPDAAAFTDLVATAGDAPEPPDVGDDAFYSEDTLYVAVDDETLVFDIYGTTLGEGDRARLEALAGSIVAIEGPGADARCDALVAAIPSEWKLGTTVGRGGGTRGDVDYELCSIEVAIGSGATLDVGVIPGLTVFDDEQANAEADAVLRIDDLGDGAVTVSDRLFVLVGDRAFMVNRETAEGTFSAGGADVEALARAVVTRQG